MKVVVRSSKESEWGAVPASGHKASRFVFEFVPSGRGGSRPPAAPHRDPRPASCALQSSRPRRPPTLPPPTFTTHTYPTATVIILYPHYYHSSKPTLSVTYYLYPPPCQSPSTMATTTVTSWSPTNFDITRLHLLLYVITSVTLPSP